MTITSRLKSLLDQFTMSESAFEQTPLAPPDPILNLSALYKADASVDKVDLGVGAYRDENGSPWVLPVVRKAEQIILNNPHANHEYLPINGNKDFVQAASRLILGGENPVFQENRCALMQSISGTGALFIGGLYLYNYYSKDATVYIPKPSWGNHRNIFTNIGFTVKEYEYYDPSTIGLNIEGMLESLRNAPNRSIIILHACAHNPTGIDPKPDQWKRILDVIKEKNHFTFFDSAYQGFASGDLDKDAYDMRLFVEQGLECFIAQSFAKNFGLYGERCGCLTGVARNEETATRLQSQLNRLSRATISTSPAYGSKIVSTVLNNPELYQEWKVNLLTMSGRIKDMRQKLFEHLVKLNTPGNWTHIIEQIGMFSFTGLNPTQVQVMTKKYHIYMTKNGRISMSGLRPSNVEYVARAIDDVVRNVKE